MESRAAIEDTLMRLVGVALRRRAEASGRPFMVGHFVTNRCMCRCASCLWKRNDWDDAPLEDLRRFYAEAKEAGFVAAAFTGGEPFLRKDLGELARFVKERAEMAILLFNTGWFLRDRMDEALPYVDMMIVSLDSARAERHDHVRGLPGLFDRLIEGVRAARRRHPRVAIHFNCCVQRGVAHEIDDLIALAEREGARISFDVITDFRHGEGGGAFTETGMGLPPAELQEVCGRLMDRKRAGAPILNSEGYFRYFAEGRRGYRCHLPKLVMFVDGRGNVEDCLNLERPIANVRETPLRDILELPRFKRLRIDAEGCWSCNSPTMVDLSRFWERPESALDRGGISIG